MIGAWATGNWHALMPPGWAGAVLALAAALAGGIVGAEREGKSKPAGLRTMAMVSLGSAVFMLLSLSIGKAGDAGRIAAQVVTGIGFLGAGAILRGPQGIIGLTTAAMIWVAAAVGMVIGAGFVGGGFAMSLGTVAILTMSDRIERRFLGPCTFEGVTVTFAEAGGKTQVKIEDVLDEYQIPVRERRITPAGQRQAALHLHYCRAHRHHKAFLTRLATLPEVRTIERHPGARTQGSNRPTPGGVAASDPLGH